MRTCALHLCADACSKDRIALNKLVYRNRFIQILRGGSFIARSSPENIDLHPFPGGVTKFVLKAFECGSGKKGGMNNNPVTRLLEDAREQLRMIRSAENKVISVNIGDPDCA
jgi:hypothetical protein